MVQQLSPTLPCPSVGVWWVAVPASGLAVPSSLEQQAWVPAVAGLGLHLGCGWSQLAPILGGGGSKGHRV